MLWNNVYEFFVKYVFGGYWLGDYYNASLGQNQGNSYSSTGHLDSLTFHSTWSGDDFILSLGNYFSLIATIITMVAILSFCVFIIKKIIAIMFRLFTGSGSF